MWWKVTSQVWRRPRKREARQCVKSVVHVDIEITKMSRARSTTEANDPGINDLPSQV